MVITQGGKNYVGYQNRNNRSQGNKWALFFTQYGKFGSSLQNAACCSEYQWHWLYYPCSSVWRPYHSGMGTVQREAWCYGEKCQSSGVVNQNKKEIILSLSAMREFFIYFISFRYRPHSLVLGYYYKSIWYYYSI